MRCNKGTMNIIIINNNTNNGPETTAVKGSMSLNTKARTAAASNIIINNNSNNNGPKTTAANSSLSLDIGAQTAAANATTGLANVCLDINAATVELVKAPAATVATAATASPRDIEAAK